MSKASRLKKRKRQIASVPWGLRKNESAFNAFDRLATDIAKWDQKSLVSRGWAPLEAAIEAWETMNA